MKDRKNVYYVYACKVDGELKYIGKGKGSRYKHCNSGASSVAELNRDFHAGKEVTVEFVKKNLSDNEALALESSLIEEHFETLYNKTACNMRPVTPNVRKMRSARILGSSWSMGDEEEKFNQFLQEKGIDPESEFYQELFCRLAANNKALYAIELPSKTKLLVIDHADEAEYHKWLNFNFSHLAHPNKSYGAAEGFERESNGH